MFSEMVKELECRDLGVEGVRVFEFFVSCVSDDRHDKVCTTRVSRIVEGSVIAIGVIGHFSSVHLCSCGVLGDGGVI